MKIMFTVASRQVWPQIICVKKIMPNDICLLHSKDERESRTPALRLAEFFKKNKLCENVVLHEMPDDPICFMNALERLLHNISNKDDVLINITGGNKLMAVLMFNEAVTRKMPIVYFERNGELFYLLSSNHSLNVKKELVESSLTDDLDPIDILKCQLAGSYVRSAGKCLCLSCKGKEESIEKIELMIKNAGSFLKARVPYDEYLIGMDENGVIHSRLGKPYRGVHMEYIVAFVLLKLGIQRVYHGVKLAPVNAHGTTEGELDLIFNYRGHLWLVDCKDKLSSTKGINAIRQSMMQSIETGGILGKTICVRTKRLAPGVEIYAQSRGIEIVYKDNLVEGLKRILY